MIYAKNGLYSYLWALAIKTVLKIIYFSIMIKIMRHFLGSVGVREGYVLYQTPLAALALGLQSFKIQSNQMS